MPKPKIRPARKPSEVFKWVPQYASAQAVVELHQSRNLVADMEQLVEDLANAKPGTSIDWAIVRANEIVDEWRGVGKRKAEGAGVSG